MDVGQWKYQGAPFTHEDAAKVIEEGFIGFIYLITDLSNDKKYIGKKLLIGKRKLPPLKGQKRKRTKMVESDWESYYGSSELVQQLVTERKQDFTREILFLCKSKGELSYIEAREQFSREVLLRDDFYNAFIGVKLHSNHVKSLRK